MNNKLKQPLHERRIFIQRSTLVVGFILLIFALLLSRYFYLQVIQHDYYLNQAENNRIKFTSIKATRGLIYDRNHVLLADNITTYQLLLTVEKTSQLNENLDAIRQMVELSDDEITRIKQDIKFNAAFKPINIKLKLTEKEVSRFAVNQHKFIGFEIKPYLIRQYKYPEIMSHVIGYVGKINETEYHIKNQKKYARDDYVGKSGLEKFYENQLHGFPGIMKTQINAKGKLLDQTIAKTPVNGKNLELTIDIRLQIATNLAFGSETGSAIVIDPNTGELLAMLSKPGFDTNMFINGISQQDFDVLNNSPDKPMFDRNLKGGYEPGSTIKPYIALAGLYNGIINTQYKMLSTGIYRLPNGGRNYHDWKRGGHGMVDIVDAMAESVNVFFYDLAVRLGIDRIHMFLDYFGFGRLTQLDNSGEKKGLSPSRLWKETNRNMIWFPGETVITGIGQGFFVITPIQMTKALSILASRGKVSQVNLFKRMIENNS
ncbi:MAG: penicillin-binding protein 2, partial [Proteobacteria bacterium]|nr:penicillin-binding protein 2 [Pseudomonadota bacterium]